MKKHFNFAPQMLFSPVIDCSSIDAGFEMDECDELFIPGTAGRAVVMNFADIDKSLSTTSETNPNVITSIILKEGKKAFPADSLPNANVGEDGLTVGTYRNTHLHTVTIRIFKHNEEAKTFINGLTNSRVVVILENTDHGDTGETKYEVYGWDSGLTQSDLAWTTEGTDDAAYVATLSSDDRSRERSLPKSFFSTSVTATDEAIEALLNPTPPSGGGGA